MSVIKKNRGLRRCVVVLLVNGYREKEPYPMAIEWLLEEELELYRMARRDGCSWAECAEIFDVTPNVLFT